ncbi:XRE family transcriptional regulator [Trinickia dabaoshanensis]|uniref:XRE family transcriptional regulator n=1 Tax=Trinickia dabaoshanensis TaxID=564714 RepID=A0A2N7VH32_9BURK|nr:helix-turn-helix transcriptional regulator [Trinickia dabaoshanensis]PMS16460.1 XRE family transcriptional regulator [Trinickia dabaoshanensis]
MSPFSIALRQLRAELEMAQGEFASRIGLRQPYVSALECGKKMPKDGGIVRRIVGVLSLSPEQEAALWRAFQVSRQFDLPPPGAPAAAYSFFAQISEALPTLSSADFKSLSAHLVSVSSERGLTLDAGMSIESHAQKETPM